MRDDGSTSEDWRPVIGWEGLYEVSNLGRVRSLDRWVRAKLNSRKFVPGAVLRGRVQKPTAYVMIRLSDGARRVRRFLHHLVLESFGYSRPDGAPCRHLNGNPGDNRLANLAWGTARENAADRVGHGTASRGEASGMAKLTEADVHEIRRLLRQGLSHPDIASRFNVGRTNIENIKAGRTWAWLPEAA
jgi:hypothetical protein